MKEYLDAMIFNSILGTSVGMFIIVLCIALVCTRSNKKDK